MNRKMLTSWLVWLTIFTSVHADASKPSYPPPAEVKAAFRKVLDRPQVPLDIRMQGNATDKDGFHTERLAIASEKKADGNIERVPVLIIKPSGSKNERLPVVLALHGTGGNKDGQRTLLQDLARRGIMGVAIDGRYHGERNGGQPGTAAYTAAITRAWKAKPNEPQEHPFYMDSCWDIWRTVDYLMTRPDVDPQRLGVIGFSKGGIETWLAAAVDDRFKVIVPAIGVQSFRWSLDNDKWQGRAKTIKATHDVAAQDLNEPEVNAKVCRALWNKVIPGMLDQFDCPSMIRLFAGRPMLILNGELDPNCPLEGAKIAFASAEEAYKQANAADRLKIMVAKGVAHKVTDEQRTAALDWFEKWLKK